MVRSPRQFSRQSPTAASSFLPTSACLERKLDLCSCSRKRGVSEYLRLQRVFLASAVWFKPASLSFTTRDLVSFLSQIDRIIFNFSLPTSSTILLKIQQLVYQPCSSSSTHNGLQGLLPQQNTTKCARCAKREEPCCYTDAVACSECCGLVIWNHKL